MRTLPLSILLVVLALPGAEVAVAKQPDPVERERSMVVQRISLDQAVVIAQQHAHGRVVGADTRLMRGRVIHEVRILEDSGRLRIVRVDGETGRVMR